MFTSKKKSESEKSEVTFFRLGDWGSESETSEVRVKGFFFGTEKNVNQKITQQLEMTAVGFEPTPLRNGALSHRLRPLGHTVSASVCPC